MDQRRLILLGALLLSVVAASLYWYGEPSNGIAPMGKSYQAYVPETIVEGFQQTTFSLQGIRQYHMEATQVTHYSEQTTTEMLQPVITFYEHDKPDKPMPETNDDVTDWVAKANQGVIEEDGETVVLTGNVNIIKPQENQQTLSFITESLLIKPKQETATTDLPVTLKQAQHITTAKGLVIDIAAGKVELVSQVRSRYVPATL